jgi:hypothetical protein
MTNGSNVTRGLALTDSTLLGWPGVSAFVIDLTAQKASPVTYPVAGQVQQFYEVSILAGLGSWWLPTAPQAQVPGGWYADELNGVESLSATGAIPTTSGTQPILRLAATLIWIPEATLAQAGTQPTSFAGEVLGTFPSFPPPAPPQPVQTRSLFLLDATLMGWSGVGVYSVATPGATPTPLAYTPIGQGLLFYEVSVVDEQGSWWLPVAPQSRAPSAWSQSGFGGAIPLQATGPGIWTTEAGQPIVRPQNALWWVPELALADNGAFVPAINLGMVTGTFPTLEPFQPGGGGSSGGGGTGGSTSGGGGAGGGGGSPPSPGAPQAFQREPEGGPWARQHHLMRQRSAPPGVGPPSLPLLASHAARTGRAAAQRQHREQVRQANAGVPMALAVRPSAQPTGGARRSRFGQPAQPGVVNWVPLGPAVVLNGMAATRPPVSGRVAGVAISADGQRIYVGSANGGVWRSDDAGRTFYPLMNSFELHPTTNHADSLSVGAILCDPAHPDRVYVGSGEGNLSDAYFGVGPIVSTDGGMSWRLEPAPAAARWFFQLAMDPTDPELVIGATSDYLIRRQPRNAAVAGLPAIKPQSYFVRYDSRTGAYSVNYWAHDGNSAFDVFAAGALSWQRYLTLTAFVNRGEPWFVTYEPQGSYRPWRAGGEFHVYRLPPNGHPVHRQTGTWALNLLLMPFELDGLPYFVRYAPSTGLASLDVWNADGTRTAVWANREWERGLSQLMPFTLGGVPHFLAYRQAGTVFGSNWAMLYAWTGTGDRYAVWREPRQLGNYLSLMPFEIDGVPYFQMYDSSAGSTSTARWEANGDYTVVSTASTARGQTFTPFTLRGRPRAVGYNPDSGEASLYAYDDEGRRHLLWRAQWSKYLRLMPFSVGYEWVRPNPAADYVPAPAVTWASSVVVGRRGDQTAFFCAFWNGGIYRSLDAGRTWQIVGLNAPGIPGAVGRITLAVQATNTSVLYAQIQNGQIWRYDVAAGLGGNWVRMANEPANYVGGVGMGVPPPQGDYDLVIAVAPDDVNRIYLGGSTVNAPPAGPPPPQMWSASIYRCDVNVAGATMANTYIGTSAHADLHALVFTPGQANALWAATDGGLFYAADPAKVAGAPGSLDRLFTSLNTGLASMTVNGLGQHPTQDAIVFSANQDNGQQRYTGAAAWAMPLFPLGDSGRVVVNPTPAGNGQQVLATYTGMRIYRSADGGNAWLAAGAIPVVANDSANFYAPLVTATAAAGALAARVVFGTRAPWYSADFGQNWLAVGGILGPAAPNTAFNINAMALSADALQLYVGLMNGQIWKYIDAGGVAGPVNWGAAAQLDNAVAGPLPAWAAVPITSIVVDPDPATNGNAIFITLGGDLTAQAAGWQRVWYYDNVAAAWQQRSGPLAGGTPQNLLNVQFNTLVARRVGGATQLFAGSDVGVWRSNDGGATWAPFSTALPEAPVLDLKLFPAAGAIPTLLRAATHGRGVFEYVLDDAARYRRAVQLYIRASLFDRGLYPVQDGAVDPTAPPRVVNHRDGTDIKVSEPAGGADSDTFPAPADITFTEFATLADASQAARTNRRLRLYVQIHNRGVVAADRVRVMVLLSRMFDAAPPLPPIPNMAVLTAPPDLPRGYVEKVAADEAIRGTDWNTQVVLSRDDVRVGFPEVLSYDLPADTLRQAGLYCLLAIVNSSDDTFWSEELNVDRLVVADSKVAMKYLFVT